MARAFAILALGVMFALQGAAQQQQRETDVGEASVYLGAAFGSTRTNFAIAGSIGTVVDQYATVMMESGYIPMGLSTLVTHPGTIVRGSGLLNFAVTGHVRVPLRSRWEPYGLLGPAVLYNYYQKAGTLPNGSGYYFGAGDVKFGFETGGGTRFYWKTNWGFRGEYRYTITTRNFSSIMAGVFRQF